MWMDFALNQGNTTLTVQPGDIRFRKATPNNCTYHFADWPLD
jgi:hypothetical protein